METENPAPEANSTPAPGELPAAAVVVSKGITEAEFNALREERDALAASTASAEQARKKAETEAAHLADENNRLRAGGLNPAKLAAEKQKTSWLFYSQS
jgi:hypothetical protein